MYSYWLASSPQKVSGDCCHLLAKGFKMTGKLGNIFTWETSTKFKPTASFGLRFSEIKMWAPDSGNVLIFSESWRVSSILKAAFHQPLKEVGLITFTESTVVNIIYSYQMSTFWWEQKHCSRSWNAHRMRQKICHLGHLCPEGQAMGVYVLMRSVGHWKAVWTWALLKLWEERFPLIGNSPPWLFFNLPSCQIFPCTGNFVVGSRI